MFPLTNHIPAIRGKTVLVLQFTHALRFQFTPPTPKMINKIRPAYGFTGWRIHIPLLPLPLSAFFPPIQQSINPTIHDSIAPLLHHSIRHTAYVHLRGAT